MDKFSIREVIGQAVETEQLGYRYYTSMSEKFREEKKLKALFDTLAEKERRHEKRFSELYRIVGEEEPEGWDEVSQYLRAIVESEFFLGSDKALVKMKGVQDIQSAIDCAIAFEKETLLFFLGIRDAVEQKELVDEIINEERSHIMWLDRYRHRFMS